MLGRPKLVLASGSPRRLSLLNQAGIEPDALRPADVDETPKRGELPRACANRLARAKADAALKSVQLDDELRGDLLDGEAMVGLQAHARLRLLVGGEVDAVGVLHHGVDEPLTLEALDADITALEVDAIANAANTRLLHGGGVAAAIARAGGPAVDEESRAAAPIGLGEAVETSAGAMPARWVIHTVGPVWAKTIDKSDTLASCYRESLRVAAGLGARTVAFPAISAGIYGWPMEDAARIAVETCHAMADEVGGTVDEVLFVPYGKEAETAFRTALDRVERG